MTDEPNNDEQRYHSAASQQQQPFASTFAAREAFGSVLFEDVKKWIALGTEVWKSPRSTTENDGSSSSDHCRHNDNNGLLFNNDNNNMIMTDPYHDELETVRDLASPLIWGFGATITTFVAFRFTGSLWFRNNVVARLRSTTTPSMHGGERGGEPRRHQPRRPNIPRADEPAKEAAKQDLSSLPTDILLSCVMGLWATAFLVEPQRMATKLGRVPLSSGKSLLSEVSCQRWTEYYHRVPWDEPGLRLDRDSLLLTLRDFVEHCQVRDRAKMILRERQQEEEQGGVVDGQIFVKEKTTAPSDEETTATASTDTTDGGVAIPLEVMDQAMSDVASGFPNK